VFELDWLSNLDRFEYTIITLIALSAAAVSFFYIFSYFIRARIVEDTPTSKIRSASQGYTEIIGRAKPIEQPILAKLSLKPCLWYRYKIEKYQSSGDSSGWSKVEDGSSDDLFLIKDNTGICRVDPDKADVSVSSKNRWYGRTRYPGGFNRRTSFFNKDYRYTEERIHSGDPLYIVGLFQTIRGPSVSEVKSGKVAELLKLWKSNHNKLIQRFDRNNDGEIDLAEWEEARQQAIQQVEEQHEQGESVALHLLTSHPGVRYPYLIATKSQRDLVTKYRIRAACYLIGFLAASAISFVLLTARF
jgi:hypothetical protein